MTQFANGSSSFPDVALDKLVLAIGLPRKERGLEKMGLHDPGNMNLGSTMGVYPKKWVELLFRNFSIVRSFMVWHYWNLGDAISDQECVIEMAGMNSDIEIVGSGFPAGSSVMIELLQDKHSVNLKWSAPEVPVREFVGSKPTGAADAIIKQFMGRAKSPWPLWSEPMWDHEFLEGVHVQLGVAPWALPEVRRSEA